MSSSESTPASPIFGIDAASYQGSVSWSEVAQTCAFGFEKVTQGTSYVNPYWATSKPAMAALGATKKFVPGAYLFLEAGNGAAQADFFHSKAGDLSGFMLVVDAEPTGSSNPKQADLNDVVQRLRTLYPNHLIGGYAPEWYWGTQPLIQFDWLWASRYVNGSGSPAALYTMVPSSWWGNYGGRTVEVLQFSASSSVPGVAGSVDVSAYHGNVTELAALITKPVSTNPPPPSPVPVPAYTGGSVYVFDKPQHEAVVLPIPAGKTKVVLYADPGASGGNAVSIRLGASPPWGLKTLSPTWEVPAVFDLVAGQKVITIARLDTGSTPVTVDFE